MEITNFVTENFLSSFAGTLLAIELIVFTTKGLPLIKKIPTKLYTFILAVIHLTIVEVTNGKVDITVEFVYILLINSLIVEVILCGGYDTLFGKFRNIQYALNQSGEDISKINNENMYPSNSNEVEKNNNILNK